jgi:predicted PolB exonuclease-like 3'-5' exonuclease
MGKSVKDSKKKNTSTAGSQMLDINHHKIVSICSNSSLNLKSLH